MGTGVEKVAVCHPLADSLEKVTSASLVPVLVQSVPICVPLLPGLFQKRMLLIKPFSEERKRTPRLTDCPSSPTDAEGVKPAGQIHVLDSGRIDCDAVAGIGSEANTLKKNPRVNKGIRLYFINDTCKNLHFDHFAVS